MANPLDIAEKVAQRAQEALDPMRMEMTMNRWPADLRAIMWKAVALTAERLAADCAADRSNKVANVKN